MNYTTLQAKLHGMEFRAPTESISEEKTEFTPDQDKILEEAMFAAIARKRREFEEKSG